MCTVLLRQNGWHKRTKPWNEHLTLQYVPKYKHVPFPVIVYTHPPCRPVTNLWAGNELLVDL